jgi:hypothetical protein
MERVEMGSARPRSGGALAEGNGGELCWKGELFWPVKGIKVNYARILRLLLTGK